MAGFKSVLSAIGHFIAKAFSPKMIQVEEGVADLILPGFAPLINSAAAAVIGAETAAAAAGIQNGTGEQKMAYALAQFGPQYDAWAKANDIPIIPENKEAFINAVVLILNSLPAPAAAQPPAQA